MFVLKLRLTAFYKWLLFAPDFILGLLMYIIISSKQSNYSRFYEGLLSDRKRF